jgi:adenylate kinase
MAEPWKSILLVGLPGSGKSTHARALAQLPGFYHCEAGDVFRSIDPASDAAAKIEPYMQGGNLVPDELAVTVWRQAMQQRIDRGDYDPAREILLLDGMPRTLPQAELLDDAISMRGVVYLDCDDETKLIERLLARGRREGRSDDASETMIRHRLESHRRQVLPVLDHYPAQVARIDACQDALEALIAVATAVRAFRDG